MGKEGKERLRWETWAGKEGTREGASGEECAIVTTFPLLTGALKAAPSPFTEGTAAHLFQLGCHLLSVTSPVQHTTQSCLDCRDSHHSVPLARRKLRETT